MRQLHPVSFHEKFVASGTYLYYEDGQPTGDVEYWTLHEPGAGSLTFRSDRDGRAGSGIDWLCEGLLLLDADGERIERFDAKLLHGDVSALTSYIFQRAAVDVRPLVNGKKQLSRLLKLPRGYRTFTLATVMAYRFAPLAARQGITSLQVFTPIPAGVLEGKMLGGIVRQFELEALGEDEQRIGDQTQRIHGYRLTDQISGEAHVCWFDARDILIRDEEAPHKVTLLTEYAHRPD